MSTPNLNYLSKAIYYWDWYLLDGDIDNLTAAYQFMQDYRRSGGTDYPNAWDAMQAHVAALTQTPEKKLATPVPAAP